MTHNFSYNDFLRYENVSRETFLKLESFVNLLKKWQKHINLVSNATLEQVWERHIIDSAQLTKYIGVEERVADLGSGGGMPGIILSICGIKHVTLIESDMRKGAFLKEVVRFLGLEARVLCERVEHCDMPEVDVFTARAFASLKDVLTVAAGHMKTHHKFLLLKGRRYEEEMKEARKEWIFESEHYPSVTGEGGVILSLHSIRAKHQGQPC